MARRRRAYQRGGIDTSITLGTLASKTAVGADVSDSVIDTTWCSSVKLAWSWDGATVDEGPLVYGVAHSDYSNAEIEEFIELNQQWNRGDLIAQEVGQRKIRIIGNVALRSVSGDMNDGKSITTKCKWIFTEGATIQCWAYNLGSGALTTGAAITATGHANLWPK